MMIFHSYVSLPEGNISCLMLQCVMFQHVLSLHWCLETTIGSNHEALGWSMAWAEMFFMKGRCFSSKQLDINVGYKKWGPTPFFGNPMIFCMGYEGFPHVSNQPAFLVRHFGDKLDGHLPSGCRWWDDRPKTHGIFCKIPGVDASQNLEMSLIANWKNHPFLP